METKRALFISQHIAPYLPAGPLADYGRDTAQGILEAGIEVRTFMPKYGMINERRNQLHEVIRLSGLNIIIDDADHPLVIKVATLQPSRMQVYFIDNEDYFGYGKPGTLETESSPAENDERAIFFARGVIETVKKLRWIPDIVQCTGWITALAPMYMRVKYSEDPTVHNSRIVYALQNDNFNGPLDTRLAEKLLQEGFTAENLKGLADNNTPDINALHRLAIDWADAIVESGPDMDAELVEYAKSTGKPFLPYPGNDIRAYLDFYNTLQ